MRNATPAVKGGIVANLAVSQARMVAQYNATPTGGLPITDDEAVDNGGIAVEIGNGIDNTLGVVAIQDAGMGLEIPQRQVVVIRFVSLESPIDLGIAQQCKSIFIQGETVIGTFLDPDGVIIQVTLVNRHLQLVCGVFPRGTVARAVRGDVDDPMAVAVDGDVREGKKTSDDSLFVGKARRVVEGEIAVGNTVPAEVEMKQAVVVIAIANEGVIALPGAA